MIPQTERYLTMVTTQNNNKFYRMVPNLNMGTFTAFWGRIGTAGAQTIFPIHLWDTKYNEKIAKGYTDQSDSILGPQKNTAAKDTATKNNSKTVRSEGVLLLQRLSSFVKTFIRSNYITNGAETTIKVNPLMIAKVDTLLTQMKDMVSKDCSVDSFNQKLSEVFMAIPRQMRNTKSYYASSKSSFLKILERESSFIDTLRSIAKANAKKNENINFDDSTYENIEKTINEHGLKIYPATEKQNEEIKRHMGDSKNRFVKAWRIENENTKKSFSEYTSTLQQPNIKQLWHGSRNENFHSILCSGLLTNPNASITGKMFGHGIYFAPSFHKSMGYTSIRNSFWAKGSSDVAFIAVFDVALGKSLDVTTYDRKYESFTEKDIKTQGCNSLFAHRSESMLRNDEIVVYNEHAATIRYLVEIK